MTRTKQIGLIMILLLIAIVVYNIPQRQLAGIEALEALVTTAGADIVEGEVQFYANLEPRFQEMDEIEAILMEVADLLELEGGHIVRADGATYRVIDVLGLTTFSDFVHIVVQSNPGDGNNFPPQTYLLVTCRDTSVTRIATTIEQLTAKLTPYSPTGQLSYYLTGEIAGQKQMVEMEQMAQAALLAVRGIIVEGMQDTGIISYTAYTPLLDRYLTSDGEKFNLNVAIRYDNYHNRTVVWAGFPLIHDEY